MKNKWSLWAALAALALALPASAIIQPQVVNFQGKLIDPATNLPKTGTVNLTFNLYKTLTGGTALWTETQNLVALTNGVFSVELGTYTALPPELFLGASAYLGVTVQGDAEMAPRSRLAMSPYAFTANQLSDAGSVSLIADNVYSTFTNAGNLALPGGVSASSAAFANGVNAASATFTQFVTASSGIFTAAGTGAFGLTVSSGVLIQNGVLDMNGAQGITNSYGLQTGTLTVTGPTMSVGGSSFTVAGGSATVAYGLTAGTLSLSGAGASAGGVLYMTASGSMSVTAAGTAGFALVSGGAGAPVWDNPSVTTITSMPLTAHSGTSAVANNSLTVRKTGLFRIAGRLTVNQLTFAVGAVTTAGTYKICVYTEDGLTKVIDVTSGAPAVGANNVAVAGAPVLSSGLYYVAMGCATTCSNTVFQWTTVSVAGFNAATVPAGKKVLEGTTTHTSGTCNATLPAITPAISSTPMIRFDN
ncbi:MAG: hypothetical protein HY079_06030 [Elusimicrobia bacterium]|nr:hypothetical protein [Elusimicrobiota bacterium]